jgi:hypothetical protein
VTPSAREGVAERRSAPRIPARVEAAYEDAERQLFLVSSDLSESGIFLLAPDPPAAGGAVRLTLELPGCPELVRLAGVVARRQLAEPVGFAVRFDAASFSDGTRSSLRRWLQETAQPAAQ